MERASCQTIVTRKECYSAHGPHHPSQKSMTYDEAVEFLRAKFELIAENAYTEEREAAVRDFARLMESSFTDPRNQMESLLSLDRSLEAMLLKAYVLGVDIPDLRAQLTKRFGTSRLSVTGRTVARRVLKRGEIKDTEEYHGVREFLACVDNIKVVGDENYAILDSIADAFQPPDDDSSLRALRLKRGGGVQPSIRKSFPPFDLVIEANEKLPPAGTTLANLEAFLLAKAALLAACFADDDAKKMLKITVTSGIAFALGSGTAEANRDQGMERVEHDLEACTALKISGVEYRAIELDLDRRFGFWRIGSSAPVRIARLLTSGDIPRGLDCLVIGNFFRAYKNQTLFPVGRASDCSRGFRPARRPNPFGLRVRRCLPTNHSSKSAGCFESGGRKILFA